MKELGTCLTYDFVHLYLETQFGIINLWTRHLKKKRFRSLSYYNCISRQHINNDKSLLDHRVPLANYSYHALFIASKTFIRTKFTSTQTFGAKHAIIQIVC